MLDAFFIENNEFRPFTWEHLIVLLLGIVVFTLLIRFARRSSSEKRVFIGATIAYTILATYLVVFISIDAMKFGFDPKKHLPFAMCNVCGVTVWLALHKKNYLAYEILFFWIMTGTLAACLMPEIKQAFPHYTFFAFWTIHIGLVGGAIYATMVYGMRPGFWSVVKSFIALNIYTLVVGGLNWLMSAYDANYFYTCHKPDVWTPLNWFGEWPWYLIWGQWFGAALFLIVYAPFGIYDAVLYFTGRIPIVGQKKLRHHDDSES